MTRVLRALVAAAIIASLAIVPAGAETTACVDPLTGLPVFTETPQWVKAPAKKLGNLGAAGTGDAYPTWNGEAPTQSVTAGAGGGSIQSRAGNPQGQSYDPAGAGHFEGTFTGCINNMTWDLYMLSPLPATDTVVTIAELRIDGTPVFVNPGDPAPEFNVVKEGDTGALYRMKFSFTDIYTLMSTYPGDFAALDGEHTLSLTLYTQYVNEAQGAYVYDTTEAPTSVTFNKADVAGYTVLPANQ